MALRLPGTGDLPFDLGFAGLRKEIGGNSRRARSGPERSSRLGGRGGGSRGATFDARRRTSAGTGAAAHGATAGTWGMWVDMYTAPVLIVREPSTVQYPQQTSREMSMAARRRVPQLRLRYPPSVAAVRYTS